MIPAPLAEIVEDFAASPREMRLQMLLGYAQGLPDLPDRYADQDTLERVQECQTPFFLAVEIDDDRNVSLFFDAPPEAPTTRGYAGILAEGLDGATVDEVLAAWDSHLPTHPQISVELHLLQGGATDGWTPS